MLIQLTLWSMLGTELPQTERLGIRIIMIPIKEISFIYIEMMFLAQLISSIVPATGIIFIPVKWSLAHQAIPNCGGYGYIAVVSWQQMHM